MHISERLRERSQSLRRTFMERELIYRTFNFETLVGDIRTPVLHPPNVLFSSFPLLLGPRGRSLKTLAVSARNRTEVNVIAGGRDRKLFRSRFADDSVGRPQSTACVAQNSFASNPLNFPLKLDRW